MKKLEVLIFTVQGTQILCQSPNIGKTSVKRERLSLCLPREESALLRELTGVSAIPKWTIQSFKAQSFSFWLFLFFSVPLDILKGETLHFKMMLDYM